MLDTGMDLAGVRILLTNDDGINAEGLRVLERVARALSEDVWIVAPEVEQSGASHSLTIHRPLRMRPLDDRRFAVDGTPTDCVLLAVNRIMAEHRPDIVFSGINMGSNIGEDVTYSGTIAAAMEATLLGVPAIALSQDFGSPSAAPWQVAEAHAADVLRRLVVQGWSSPVLMNVNFPSCPMAAVRGVRVARQGGRKIGDELVERSDPRGRKYFWIGPARSVKDERADTDVALLRSGAITVTPLHLDLTHDPTLQALEQTLT